MARIVPIHHDVPEGMHVELRVYDVPGRGVATLVNENRLAAHGSVTWNMRDFPGRCLKK